MTTFITLFVAIQLLLGFCALLLAIHQAKPGYENEIGFHLLKKNRETKPERMTPAIAVRSSGLYLSEQCGWR
jgi:hypothetical protein